MKKEVKTRFPVARIKKLMQSDDDIGKVAQATPIVVAKALELFMISLIEESCNQARNTNSKRVAPAHLKQAVMNTDQFDFLQEVVDKYPNPIANDSEDTETTGRRKGRKPKVEE
ncbi:DNA polymerase epsilon subunit C [Nadsonia fulvescens var. elongata DSM 6958]|uniref:DNA polymerase epsilon subunit C n=1 Tax=Nadsonia fulvescens var. elongata DSM 6958 TaxID=857566 RepID=A0A1E3PSL1_9ASCO|nr:DNA polymerase epsilon subunit C [Nadsonia fulvescens var. elongata DSM 6958]